jgi:hypothetical protein
MTSRFIIRLSLCLIVAIILSAGIPARAAPEAPAGGIHPAPLGAPNPDTEVLDDLIVTGGTCIGTLCSNGYQFYDYNLVIRDPIIRMLFDDTSAGSPNNDWALLMNDPSVASLDYFAIYDISAGQTPLLIYANAGTNTLVLDDTDRVGIGTSSPSEKLHVAGNILADGYVKELSDRNAKTGFAAVDKKALLERLAGMPLTTWSYKEEPGVRHIGPIAQDFYAAFGLGADETHLAALDTNGVALAAIQALQDQMVEKDTRIQNLESQVAALSARLAALEGAGASMGVHWISWLSWLGAFGAVVLALRRRA